MCQILIVHNKNPFRDLFRGVLEEMGEGETRLGEASNNGEALHELQQAKPDLIFLDLTLSEGHALDLIGMIKRLFPQIVTVVLIDFDIPEYVDTAYERGADHVFVLKSSLCLKEDVAAVHSAPPCTLHH